MSNQGHTYTAEGYAEWREHRAATAPYFREIYGQISRVLEPFGEILDVAGGEGHTHEVLPEEFSSRLVTVDIDDEALQRLTSSRPEARTVQGDTGKLPFDDETFEAAIALNAINRTHKDEAPEITRVLKPGGLLVFLYDLPHPMQSVIADYHARPGSHSPDDVYDLPIINPATRNMDQLVSIPRRMLEGQALRTTLSGRLALEAVEELLAGDWMENVFGDPLKTAAYAKLFARLAAEVQAVFGEATIWEPYAPLAQRQDMAAFTRLDNVATAINTLSVDTETDEVHTIRGEAVSRLYVDELTIPQIIYKPEATSTKIKGTTPVFTVKKKS